MLLEIGAVNFNTREPYTLASGLPSPSYIDCRKLISYPRIRSTLMDFLTVTVMRDARFRGLRQHRRRRNRRHPFAALVAERMGLPMTYVRKKPKDYGRNARIEGAMSEGQRVLLVEDLTTDGGSKLSFVDAIRQTGATCAHTAVIFYYGIFPETEKTLGDHGVRLHHLCTWWDVLAEARAAGAFDAETLAEVENFLNAPANGRRRTGADPGRDIAATPRDHLIGAAQGQAVRNLPANRVSNLHLVACAGRATLSATGNTHPHADTQGNPQRFPDGTPPQGLSQTKGARGWDSR
ncbi:orotate phosphoribosyltransferase [Jhaorihella thermophila]